MQQFNAFWNQLQNLQANAYDGTVFSKVSTQLRASLLSVFRTPFYGCFQTLNRNAFLWMITLLGAKTPESSKICQKVVAYSKDVRELSSLNILAHSN